MQSYLTMGNKYGVKMKSVGGGMESFSVRKPDSSPVAYLSMSNSQLKMYGGCLRQYPYCIPLIKGNEKF